MARQFSSVENMLNPLLHLKQQRDGDLVGEKDLEA
jgi:hypothetical protein